MGGGSPLLEEAHCCCACVVYGTLRRRRYQISSDSVQRAHQSLVCSGKPAAITPGALPAVLSSTQATGMSTGARAIAPANISNVLLRHKRQAAQTN